MTLLGVVDNLIHRIEAHQHEDLDIDDAPLDIRSGSGKVELDEVSDDFAETENLEYSIKKGLELVKSDMEIFADRMKYRLVSLSCLSKKRSGGKGLI